MSDIKNRKAAVELEKLIDKKLDNWDERSCFTVKGVKNLSRSDMDTLQLYLNGNERTEDFLFNLTEAELTEMEMSVDGGLAEKINKIARHRRHPNSSRSLRILSTSLMARRAMTAEDSSR